MNSNKPLTSWKGVSRGKMRSAQGCDVAAVGVGCPGTDTAPPAAHQGSTAGIHHHRSNTTSAFMQKNTEREEMGMMLMVI